MSLTTLASCIQYLEVTGLLDAARAAELRRAHPESLLEPLNLLRQLVECGWLTPFQAQALTEGHGADLLVGRYVVLDRLGGGSMGDVYRARCRETGRDVALKLIRPDRLRHPAARRRFERETWLATRLAHPNLVLAVEAGEAGGRHFLALELLDGLDLGRLVERKGPLPVRKACEYIRQAALGLQYAHEHRLVHRDIKPGNLFLMRSGVVKLLDLGLARLDDPSDDDGLTHAGTVLGTPDFIAPEQARDAHGADIRADLYSLGCTFFYLLTGRPPFPGGSAVEKFLRHQNAPPPDVRELRPEVSEAAAGIVACLLAKDPAARFQTPAELAEALARLPAADATPVPLPPALDAFALPRTPPPGRRKSVPDEGRRHVTAALVAGAVLVGMALGAAVWFGSRGSGRPVKAAPPPETTLPKPPRAVFRQGDDPLSTVLATLRANRVPTFEDGWYVAGPFDNTGRRGVNTAFGPEVAWPIDLKSRYRVSDATLVGWLPFREFHVGAVQDLGDPDEPAPGCLYLLNITEAREAETVPLLLGANDTLTVWVNGEKVLARDEDRPCEPGRDRIVVRLRTGTNQILFKVCNTDGDWQFYLEPRFPRTLEQALGTQLPARLRWER